MLRFTAKLLGLTVVLPWLTVVSGRAADLPGGVALAIVMDTSGSMRDRVKDTAGVPTPKHVIANRALTAVVDRLEQAVQGGAGGVPLTIEAGLVVFDRNQARFAVPFGKFAPDSFRRWAAGASNPDGATPLGRATELAARTVLAAPGVRKHVLVITDGENTVGPEPAKRLPELRREAEQAQATVAYHFVAFDVEAEVFAPLKRLGATLVGAGDEAQLHQQLQLILEHHILLEDEEPPAHPPAKTQ